MFPLIFHSFHCFWVSVQTSWGLLGIWQPRTILKKPQAHWSSVTLTRPGTEHRGNAGPRTLCRRSSRPTQSYSAQLCHQYCHPFRAFKRTQDWKARFIFGILGLDISHWKVVAGSRAGPHSSAANLQPTVCPAPSFLSIPPVAIPPCGSTTWAPVL